MRAGLSFHHQREGRTDGRFKISNGELGILGGGGVVTKAPDFKGESRRKITRPYSAQ